MTQPCERTKAITDTRRLLETLEASAQPLMWDLVRTAAMNALRHYPLEVDIAASAVALPSVWAVPLPMQKNSRTSGYYSDTRCGSGKLHFIGPKSTRVTK